MGLFRADVTFAKHDDDPAMPVMDSFTVSKLGRTTVLAFWKQKSLFFSQIDMVCIVSKAHADFDVTS